MINIAELTNNANVKSDIDSSAIEYLRQNFIAGREGKYGCLSECTICYSSDIEVLRPK